MQQCTFVNNSYSRIIVSCFEQTNYKDVQSCFFMLNTSYVQCSDTEMQLQYSESSPQYVTQVLYLQLRILNVLSTWLQLQCFVMVLYSLLFLNTRLGKLMSVHIQRNIVHAERPQCTVLHFTTWFYACVQCFLFKALQLFSQVTDGRLATLNIFVLVSQVMSPQCLSQSLAVHHPV